MNALYALVAVAILFLIVYLGTAAANLEFVFGIVVPYAAAALFLLCLLVVIPARAGGPTGAVGTGES